QADVGQLAERDLGRTTHFVEGHAQRRVQRLVLDFNLAVGGGLGAGAVLADGVHHAARQADHAFGGLERSQEFLRLAALLGNRLLQLSRTARLQTLFERTVELAHLFAVRGGLLLGVSVLQAALDGRQIEGFTRIGQAHAQLVADAVVQRGLVFRGRGSRRRALTCRRGSLCCRRGRSLRLGERRAARDGNHQQRNGRSKTQFHYTHSPKNDGETRNLAGPVTRYGAVEPPRCALG